MDGFNFESGIEEDESVADIYQMLCCARKRRLRGWIKAKFTLLRGILAAMR